LPAKIGQALWEARKRDEDALLMEFLEAVKTRKTLRENKAFPRLEKILLNWMILIQKFRL